jgi:hypothetical protein
MIVALLAVAFCANMADGRRHSLEAPDPCTGLVFYLSAHLETESDACYMEEGGTTLACDWQEWDCEVQMRSDVSKAVCFSSQYGCGFEFGTDPPTCTGSCTPVVGGDDDGDDDGGGGGGGYRGGDGGRLDGGRSPAS